MRFFLACVLYGILTADVCLSDDSKESEVDDSKTDETKGLSDLGDVFAEPAKGLGEWFRSAAGEAKERSESGLETAKEFSNQANIGMKGFADGIGERFGQAKEKLEEHGQKMREAITNAAEKTKEEFETAASRVSKHAKDASEMVFNMFGGK